MKKYKHCFTPMNTQASVTLGTISYGREKGLSTS